MKKLALTLTIILLPLALSFGALDTSDLERATQTGIKTIGAVILALAGIGYATLLTAGVYFVVKVYSQAVNKAKNDPTIENPHFEGVKAALVVIIIIVFAWVVFWLITNSYASPLRPDRVILMLLEKL